MTSEYRSFRTLGVRVDGVQIPDVIDILSSWIALREGFRYVAVTGMHGVTEARADPNVRHAINDADLVVPDGMPLVWLARRRGIGLARRVYGPELMETFCRETGADYSHYFYGGAPGVGERLAKILRDEHGIRVAGTYSPPFRTPTPAESAEVAAAIDESGADVVWVGLSTPKQELWMHENRTRLRAPVGVGVGAAFDFLAGLKRTAPRWMQENGLEWLYRLGSEPRRLWRRYLVGGPRFVCAVAAEEWRLGRKKAP